jgi:hypothetical protein
MEIDRGIAGLQSFSACLRELERMRENLRAHQLVDYDSGSLLNCLAQRARSRIERLSRHRL